MVLSHVEVKLAITGVDDDVLPPRKGSKRCQNQFFSDVYTREDTVIYPLLCDPGWVV